MCAVFNPQVDPTRDPNFFKYSDSISQPKADESKGIELKTLGEGIEGGFKLADTVVKDVIKSDVYSQVDKERQDFSTALTNTKNYGNPAGAPAPAGDDPTPGTPVDLFTGQKASVPTAISQGIKQAGTIQAGLDGNKISQTTYYQRLDDIAVKMRTAYPGYRDYIDKEISGITGVTPANAYVDSIIQDINRQSANANKDKEYWSHAIVSSGFPRNDEVLAQYEKDGDHNKVAKYLADNNGIRSQLALRKAAFEDTNNTKATQIDKGVDLATSIATQAAVGHFHNEQYAGDMTPANIADSMADLTAHPEKANDEVYKNLASRFIARQTQGYNQTMLLLTTPQKGPDGKMTPAVSDVIGIDKTKEIVEKSYGALFKQTRDFIADKQFSPAYQLQTSAEAAVNNKIWSVFQQQGIGNVVQTYAAFNKTIPNFIPLLTTGSLGKGLDTDLAKVLEYQGKLAIGQPPGAGKYLGVDGKTIYSLKQSIEELGQASQLTGKDVPSQTYKNLTEIRNYITNPQTTPDAITNAVKYLYDPKVNKGVLDKFMDDYNDPAKGGMVRGRTSAFVDLTSDEVTKPVWKSGQENWNKYSTWAKGEFATQLGSSVRELNNEINDKKDGVTWKVKPEVTWDTDKKELKIFDKTLGGPNGDGVAHESTRLDNLNRGLRSIANIAKTEGSNVDAFVFKVLKDNGFAPDKEVNGVPAQIMRALIVGNGGKVKENAPTPSISRFAPEDVGGDLQSFLMNPAGSGAPVGGNLEPQQLRHVIKGNLSDQPIDAPIRTFR